MGNMNISSIRAKQPQPPTQTSPARYDRIETGTQTPLKPCPGLYRPGPTQMQALSNTPYTRITPDSRLQEELLPPSEQPTCTEEDALLNQYMKRSRIDGYIDGNTFVRTSSEPVGLILKDDITKADLEKFNDELIEKGPGADIDWRGVKSDFIQIGVSLDNVERLNQKADYLASRYAVLNDRIQTQYTGERQTTELQKLNQLYTEAKEEMANTYAKKIGGFYEDLGQTGVSADMRNSVLSLIDQKAAFYTDSIKKTDIYANITAPDKQWLKQDDAYMAAQLRQSASVSQSRSADTSALYDEKDLTFAGKCAKKLSQQLQNPTWNINESDASLGQHLAAQYSTMQDSTEKNGISKNLTNMLASAFEPYMDKLMNTLDASIDRNRNWVAAKPWISGLLRTDYIDRESVYGSFQNAIFKS